MAEYGNKKPSPLRLKMFLFEEITPVTQEDIEHWLNTVPKNLSEAPSRRAAYAKAYRVDDKIRAAKREGNWPQITQTQ